MKIRNIYLVGAHESSLGEGYDWTTQHSKIIKFGIFFHINFLKHIFDEERLKIAQLQLG